MSCKLINESQELLKNKKTKILNNTKPNIINKLFKRESKKIVTVVTPVYNADAFIERCINSVIDQSLNFLNIEFIIVDDKSTDKTKSILVKYAKRHKNITVVFLNENTGTPSIPRNIGIELSTTDKMLFLDADDWLFKDGLKELVQKMEDSNDDVVIGKTIKVNDRGESVHAQFMSYKDKRYTSPFNAPRIFYYMGPQSKLIKSSIIKNHNIRFPELKFAEDKSFFLNVYLNSSNISTITKPISYLNRQSDNKSSLTKTTDLLYKRSTDIVVLKEILKKSLPLEQESIILKRLIEYDLVRGCDNNIFIKSKNQHKYINYIRIALNLIKDKQMKIIESFDNPIYTVGAKLIKENRDNDFIKLIEWKRFHNNKQIIIKDNKAYYRHSLFKDDDPYSLIPIKLLARSTNAYVENNNYIQEFEIYGNLINTVDYILIRDRNNYEKELIVPIKIDGNNGRFCIEYKELNKLKSSLFTVFIRYDGHRLINIKRLAKNEIIYEDRKFNFYATITNNLGLSIKDN